ncbi:MAG: (4Fe-4S)-binding protein [Lachnospiraceae bacterium]|nr:(4Fe-4S)-binding protein [Lachnospiraceae bacterium]
MAAKTISPEEVKRLKGLGFLNNKNTDNFSARVITVNGRVTSDTLRVLADAADAYGDGHVVFTTRLTAEVTGIPYENIDAFTAKIGEAGMEPGGTGPKVRPVVSCKGTTCQYGLLDTYEISERIHERFYKGWHGITLPHKFKIAVGGCPNNCVKPTLNDIGIMGWKGGCKVYIGGRWGKQHSIGQPLSKIFDTGEELMTLIEKALLFYKENGLPGERFALTIQRIGFEEVEKQLLSDEILERKKAILS